MHGEALLLERFEEEDPHRTAAADSVAHEFRLGRSDTRTEVAVRNTVMLARDHLSAQDVAQRVQDNLKAKN